MFRFLKYLFNQAEAYLEDLLDREHNPVCGFSEEQDKFIVFVSKKESLPAIYSYITDEESAWEIDDVVPSALKGKPTDVIEVGELTIHSDRKNYRPITGGCEIAPVGENFVGTAGVVAKAAVFHNRYLVGPLASFKRILSAMGWPVDYEPVILTNAHVVVKDVTKSAAGTQIQQSGAGWGNPIGDVLYNAPLNKTSPNAVDCAVVRLNTRGDVGYVLGDVMSTTGFSQPHSGMSVHKYGRTTEYTEGECLTTNATFDINYSDDLRLRFKGCKTFTNMSSPGDSGSVIVDKQTGKIVSLLFAGSSKVTIGCDIDAALKKTGVEL